MTSLTIPAEPSLRGRHWSLPFAAAALLVLAAHFVAGPGSDAGNVTYALLMIFAAGAVFIRAALNRERRSAWLLIGLGLAFWAAGDVYYNAALLGDGSPPFPSLSDGLYFAMYACLLAGLRLLHGGARGESLLASGLVVSMLGLATVWSMLALGDVIGTATGSAAAVATTVAYPLLDLALVLSTLLIAASHDWRFDRVLGTLVVGFILLAGADSLYAHQIASGDYAWGSFADSLWPAAALAIAAAAWLAPRTGPDRVEPISVLPAAAALSVVAATAVLAVDHFERLDTITVLLATLTLVVACSQLLLLYRERTRARSAAKAAESLRSASTEAALDCVVSVGLDGCVAEWNRAAVETFGFSRERAIGSPLSDLIVPEVTRPLYDEVLEDLARTGASPMLDRRFEVIAKDAGGREFPIELAVTRVQRSPAVHTVFLRDISERRRREEENERLATIVRSSEDAMVASDLDGQITSWNQGAERLYGYSAEEALGQPLIPLVVPPAQLEELMELRVRVDAGETVGADTRRQTKDGRLVDVALRIVPLRSLSGAVVGISTTSHDITERRLREERERQDAEGHLWRERVARALAEDGLEFWGQPVVDPLTGFVDHHEMLLRMQLDGETIPPGAFLPHAESSELITAIDRRAIREGVAHAATTPVAINLSARSLGDPRVLKQIRDGLQGRRDLARAITFEITETAAAENLTVAGELVDQLRALGCGVALDDFGTGYGSFTYLKHLRVTELKIDIQFIRGLSSSTQDQRVVRSIVAVAKNFEMKTVAEGVEDEETLQLLRALDVDLVQGYHLGRPAPIAALDSRAPAMGAKPVSSRGRARTARNS